MLKVFQLILVCFGVLISACTTPQDAGPRIGESDAVAQDKIARNLAQQGAHSLGVSSIDASGNAPPPETAVTPQWTEQYLENTQSALLSGSERDHVNSYYYFGVHGERTLIGLERVKGNDFRQYFSLLIFDQKTLLGYYENIPNLPFVVTESGQLTFPRGYELNDTILIQENTFPPLCLAEYACVEWVDVRSTDVAE